MQIGSWTNVFALHLQSDGQGQGVVCPSPCVITPFLQRPQHSAGTTTDGVAWMA